MTRLLRLSSVVIALVAIGSLLWAGLGSRRAPVEPMAELRHAERPLTIALAGDTLAGRRFAAVGDWGPLRGVLQEVSTALTDLDQPMREVDGSTMAGGRPAWPGAEPMTARSLKQLGFGIVTLANDHASGPRGDAAEQTQALLTRSGLWSAGAGRTLEAARAPVVVGEAPRRIAVISVTTSVTAEARASQSRGDVAGRPGANSLRYSAVVTAAPPTFAALAQMAQTLAAEGQRPPASGALTINGTLIKPGTATSVELVPNDADLEALLEQIRSARRAADIVILSMHSHEPGNRSEVPADFVRSLAHQAIEAGAAIVAGHGPRQLRGIEVYRGGAILYSLGSFAFERSAVPEGAETLFDTEVSAYDVALDAIQPTAPPRLPTFEEAFWWESALVTAGFTGDTLTTLTVIPLTLEASAAGDRGIPRLATGEQGQAILGRLDRLSAPYGTVLTLRGDRAVVTLGPP